MYNFKKPYTKILIILIIFALLLPTIILTSGILPQTNVEAANVMNKDDKKIAEEISNMTGVNIEEVFKLKNNTITWNEVLIKLKNQKTNEQGNKDARSIVSAQNGLDDNFLKKLNSEGFKNEEITEVKMLVERVIFELEEITASSSENVKNIPSTVVETNKNDEADVSAFSELLSKMDTKTAVYLLLKLNKDFGTNENTFDEYLLSLQIDVDLGTYIIDKDSYEKEKNEKSVGVDTSNIITLAKIEERMLKNLQKDTPTDNDNKSIKDGELVEVDGTSSITDESPKLPLPDVESTKPRNPSEDVIKEVNEIKDRSLNNGIMAKEK
jgi:3-methyladenine DNA glycosylase Tag